MKTIGINVSFLRKPYTGIGQVTTHFLHTLIAQEGMNRIFAKYRFILYLEEDINWKLPENFEKRVVLPFWKRDDLFRKWLWEAKTVPEQAQRDGCEAFISLYQSATCLPKSIHHSMVVHDIIPKMFPEYLNTMRKRLYEKAIEQGMIDATTLLAVSRRTEKDLVQYMGVSAQKTHVAYIDVDPVFSKPVSVPDKNRVMKQHHIEPGYIYYGGGLETRKNVHNLLLAYRKILKERSRFSDQETVIPDLVISGMLLPKLAPLVTDVAKEVREMNLGNYVHILGRVDQKDLPALYAGARLFVFPSKYEGFGMPVLEAMRVGIPVLTSKRASLPEVAGDAAIYCDPESVDDIARSMLNVLGKKNIRDVMVQRGHEQAKKFSWKKFTEKALSSI